MKRMFRTVRMFAALLAIGSPALGASDPDELLLLAGQMRNAHYARIGVAGRTLVLIDPGVTTSGLVYRRVEGFPRQRPAMFAGADWDSVPAPRTRFRRRRTETQTERCDRSAPGT